MKINPLVDGINALITKRSSLRFYEVDYNMGPLWILSGITPVGVEVALGILATEGKNVTRLRGLFQKQEDAKNRRHARRMALVESAKKKLTAAEIAACNL